MYSERLDRWLKIGIALMLYVLVITEIDHYMQRFEVCITYFFYFTFPTALRWFRARHGAGRRQAAGKLFISLLCCIVVYFLPYIHLLLFIIGLIVLAVIVYKVFEYLGDKVEQFLERQGVFPILIPLSVKLIIWITGAFVCLNLFIRFIYWYITYHQSLLLTDIYRKFPFEPILGTTVIILSLIMAIFVINLNIKMIHYIQTHFYDVVISRAYWWKIIFLIFSIAVSVDFSYGLLYAVFGKEHELSNEFSISGQLEVLQEYVLSSYYAFTIHHSLEPPENEFFIDMKEKLAQNPLTSVIIFFHINMNRIVDFAMLAYVAVSVWKFVEKSRTTQSTGVDNENTASE